MSILKDLQTYLAAKLEDKLTPEQRQEVLDKLAIVNRTLSRLRT